MTNTVPRLIERFKRADPDIVVPILLTAVVWGIYGQTVYHGFISYDDPMYVTENAHVLKGISVEGLKYAFTSLVVSNWQPLAFLSHMLDIQLFGLSPGAHHSINVTLHLLNAIFVYFVFHRLTGSAGRSACVALLFAAHPQHVESVAWIAERKDVLSTLFALLTLWCYIAYAKRGGIARYALVAGLLALGLATKPMLVTLPFVLLLVDFWPLGRFTGTSERTSRKQSVRLLAEKLPLLGMAAAVSVLTFAAQSSTQAVVGLDLYSLRARVMNAAVSYTQYLWKTIAPYDLAVIYEHPGESISGSAALASGGFLVLVTLAVVLLARRRPYLFVGWFWFVGTLVPVIGLVQVGETPMADRYMYLPHIGLFIAVVWGLADAAAARPSAIRPLQALAALAIVTYAVLGWYQTAYWRDTLSLFRHAETISPRVHFNLGIGYEAKNDHANAAEHFARALELAPEYIDARKNLAISRMNLGDYDTAEAGFIEIIEMDPSDPQSHVDLAVLLYRTGRVEEAIVRAETALRIESGHVNAIGLIEECRRSLGTP